MTDLEQQLTNHLRRRAAAATPRYDLEDIEQQRRGDAAVVDLTTVRHGDRTSLWLVTAAAVTILLALVGAVALLDDDQTVDTTPATDAPAVSEPPTTLEPPSLEDYGQFRAGNVIVKIQCTGATTRDDGSMGDLVYAGVVTDNPDKLATLDGVSVARGNLVALIIREDREGGRRVTLFGYDGGEWYGGATISSCDELVESVPSSLDGGYFYGIPGGYEILPGGGTADP